MDFRRAMYGGVYCASCYLGYNILLHHYHDTCKSSWLSAFLTEPTTYCDLIRRGLSVLQWAPLVFAGLVAGPVAGMPLY